MDIRQPDGMTNYLVYAIYEYPDEVGQNLWIGTMGGGLMRLDRNNNAYTIYRNRSDDPMSLLNDLVRSIQPDAYGDLWIGTEGGLDLYHHKTGRFSHYICDPDDPGSLSHKNARVVYIDKAGTLWVGTEDGLNRFERMNHRFHRYFHDPLDSLSLSNSFIYSIYEDHMGNLWIGTLSGLNLYNRDKDQFTRYMAEFGNINALSNNEILSLYEDQAGVLWIGTAGGLNRLDRETFTFSHFTIDDGLPNNLIYGILEDDHGNLWLSTNHGLSKFDPRKNTFMNFDVRDGLQSDEFNTNACFRSPSGEMFFGGIRGLNAFNPDSIKTNASIPNLVLTDFQIFNRSVPIENDSNRKSPLKEAIAETDEIELSHKDRIISFEYAALHYANPDRNMYRYKMEGFEDQWNEVGNRRFATYTNLPPGEYVFHVQGSNNDGVWNRDGIRLKIRVKPPFWATIWFRAAAILFIISGFVVVTHLKVRRIRERSKQLEKRVDERTADLKKANDELQTEIAERKRVEKQIQLALEEKEVLLREVHHRVKNNFQVISSLLNLQAKTVRDHEILHVLMESRNRVRSMALVHEKLYQSESLASINFSIYIESLARSLLRSYEIDYGKIKLITDIGDIHITIDTAIPCGLIVNELVSNSLKYAFPPDRDGNHEIGVRLHQLEDEHLELTVYDNGVGLPPDLDIQKTTSLGLKLVNILAHDQLKGQIELDRNEGTHFRIVFKSREKV